MASDEPSLTELTFVSLNEIAACSGFSARDIEELVELGVLEPYEQESAAALFPAQAIETLRVARRLQRDFDLPLAAVALALAYRERVHELEQRLRRLECQLPRDTRA